MSRRQIAQLLSLSWFLAIVCAATVDAVEQWPEFRGPHGDGSAGASQLPLTFGDGDSPQQLGKNVKWKTAIHGRGWSSPVIWDRQIWLTTATEDGKQMFALCIDRDSGKILRDQLLFENATPAFCHPTNSYASPTPAIEAGRVYLHFGSYGTACLDTQTGTTIWQRRDLLCDHWRGPGSSPILYGQALYVAFDGYDQQYVVALNKDSGETLWKRDRQIHYAQDDGDIKKAYTTCQVIEHQGRAQLISPSAGDTIAYDPETGDELWRVHHGGMNTATRPLYAQGLLYLTVGDQVGEARAALLAVRPGGTPDHPEAEIVWRLEKSPPKRPSPIVVDDLLFVVNDDGVASCLDAATGNILWHQRIAGTYRASPIVANRHIYLPNLDGDVTVIEAARQYRAVATNHFAEGFQASPAAQGNRLFLRSTAYLYCLETAATAAK